MIARFLQNNFIYALLISLLLGFLIPGLEKIPSQTLLFFLGGMIFVSSFQITISEIRKINPVQVGGFYLGRYILLPFLLWFIAMQINVSLAIGVLLLSLVPAGVASPGVSNIYKGNISLSILIVIASSLLAPFVIPVLLELAISQQVELDTAGIFKTLLFTVFLPLLLHYPFRKFAKFKLWIRQNDSLFIVPFIGILIILVISKQKGYIVENLMTVGGYVLATFIVFGVYYLFGWFASLKGIIMNKISYALASGVNNTALGIVLGFLYFPPEVSIFLVTSELAWVFGMIIFKGYLNRYLKKTL